MFESNKHHRRSVRLPHFDYSGAGAYFVTVCAARKRPVFGCVDKCEMQLNPYGYIVAEEWERTSALRSEVALDEFVVMPNHFRAIVWIKDNPKPDAIISEGRKYVPPRKPRSLSSMMAQFKATATRRINQYRLERNLPPVMVWQRSFYDRVVRDEKELLAIRRYIIENPLHWEYDEHHL